MKFELYDFQKRAEQDCARFLFESKDKSGFAVLPTGAGKSVILATLSQKFTEENPVLFVVPSIDLMRQNASAIEREGGIVGMFSGSLLKKEIKPITVATIGSLKDGKLFKSLGFKTVIVDEAHYKASEEGSFGKFIKELKPKKLLGLTATPFRTKMTAGFNCLVTLDRIRPNLFKNVVHVTQVQEVIEAGRWCPLKYECYVFDDSQIKINSSGTDYDVMSYTEENKKAQVNRNICLRLKRIISENPGEKVLVFTDNVYNANVINDWLNSKVCEGISGIVDTDVSQGERKGIVEAFKDKNSKLSILINFGTFTTGLDNPELKWVIFGRPTLSLALYYQVVGRLVRVCEGKEIATFIDFGNNVNRFGKIEDIVFKNVGNYGFGCFVNNELKTGVPIMSNVVVTEEDIIKGIDYEWYDINATMPFGKYKNRKLITLPKFYRDFLLKEFDFGTKYLDVKTNLEIIDRNSIRKLIECKKKERG